MISYLHGKLHTRKVLVVFGTRPEAIKLAGLIEQLKLKSEYFDTKVCVTAQQREMLDQVLKAFDIKPDYDLDIMQASQSLSEITGRMLMGVSDVIATVKPDIVIVHGDTTTALVASIAAFYNQVPVGHVEAGMRTFDLRSPFPEEFNRQIIGKLATWHFAPTELSKSNLLSEGVKPERIYVTGNTVIDTLRMMTEKFEKDEELLKKLTGELNEILPFLSSKKKFILVTGHRRENFGSGILEICNAIREVSLSHPEVHMVYPVHLNPNVQLPVKNLLSDLSNVHLVEPLRYEHFVFLLSQCMFVVTDSGGIQEEAPFLGKPVLVMRESTERPEAVNAGTAKLVGADSQRIVHAMSELIQDSELFKSMSSTHSPYGNGTAVEQILRIFEEN